MRLLKSSSSTTILAILALLEMQGDEPDDDKRMNVAFDAVGYQSALRCTGECSERHAWVFVASNSDQIIVRTARRSLNQLTYPQGRAASTFTEDTPRLAFSYDEHYQAAKAIYDFMFEAYPL